MDNSFFSLPEKDQIELIKRAADQFTISDIVIEKDIWICWTLEKIFELPIQMAFKGGTSLSKVFGLIKRFSEDCDVTVDYRNYKPELDLEQSRAQFKKISNKLREQLKETILKTVLPYLQEQVQKDFPEKIFEITLSEDGEQLRFYYPSMFETDQDYLRDHVFIEFGVRNNVEPCEKYQISTYVSQSTPKDLKLPKPMINTLSPIRTFWEKATLIHVECHRNRLDGPAERLSRHWYDLHMLGNSWVGEKALLSHNILKNVVEHKKAFFNASYANYDDCLSGKLRLIPGTEHLENLQNDFNKMIDSNMFYEKPRSFNEITEDLKILEEKINEIFEFMAKSEISGLEINQKEKTTSKLIDQNSFLEKKEEEEVCPKQEFLFKNHMKNKKSIKR